MLHTFSTIIYPWEMIQKCSAKGLIKCDGFTLANKNHETEAACSFSNLVHPTPWYEAYTKCPENHSPIARISEFQQICPRDNLLCRGNISCTYVFTRRSHSQKTTWAINRYITVSHQKLACFHCIGNKNGKYDYGLSALSRFVSNGLNST